MMVKNGAERCEQNGNVILSERNGCIANGGAIHENGDILLKSRIIRQRVIASNDAMAAVTETMSGLVGPSSLVAPAQATLSERLYEVDMYLTKALSVCATNSSALGHIRPLVWLLELSGTGYVWLPLPVIVLLVTQSPPVLQFAMNLMLGLTLDLLIVGTIKVGVRRNRPRLGENDMVGVIAMDKFSFPSGHATRGVMVSGMLLGRLSVGPAVGAGVVLWCLLVCLSRVALGRHHVSDVLCGVAIGLAQYLIMDHYWLEAGTCRAIITPIHNYMHTWAHTGDYAV